MPWVPVNPDSSVYDDLRGDAGFILDNDVDLAIMMPWLQGRLGLSVVTLPQRLRRAPDAQVLAEAKRQDRILVTHDRRFLDKKNFRPEDNPGVIIIPGGHGDDDLGLIGSALIFASDLRYAFSETVLDLIAGDRGTIWNHSPDNGEIEPISVRVRMDAEHPIEMWWDEEKNGWGQAPPQAWDAEIERT